MTQSQEPKDGGGWLQAARPLGASLMAAGCLVLAGCGGGTRDAGPVAWWHGLEGGPIAAERPPPPDASAPYPNLATVPPKPKPIDPALRASTDAALAADRADATYEARLQPLAAPAPAKAADGLFAPAKALPAAGADAAGAALDAVAPKPAAGVAGVGKAGAAAAVGGSSAVDTPVPDIVAQSGPLPPIPDAPPAPPHLAGVAIPVTVAHLPPHAPPVAPVIAGGLSVAEATPVSIGFAEGSARLPLQAEGALRALAARRGMHAVMVVGFGEADGLDAQSEVAGLRLGFARARAIAAVMQGVGVPMAALRLAAAAAGRGAAARLVD